MSKFVFDKRISHAYIVSSASRELREREAKRLAAAMVCAAEGDRPCEACKNCRKAFSDIHPDIIMVEGRQEKGKKKTVIPVDRIREIAADASIMPNEAERKVYIIFDADAMNINAQNAILKLLEEPPGGVSLILCAENVEALLSTVRSRCTEIQINTDYERPSGETVARAETYLKLAGKGDRAGLVRLVSSLEKLKQDEAAAFAEEVRSLIADILCKRRENTGLSEERLLEIAGLMKKARRYLLANVGIKHVFGLLAAKTIIEN